MGSWVVVERCVMAVDHGAPAVAGHGLTGGGSRLALGPFAFGHADAVPGAGLALDRADQGFAERQAFQQPPLHVVGQVGPRLLILARVEQACGMLLDAASLLDQALFEGLDLAGHRTQEVGRMLAGMVEQPLEGARGIARRLQRPVVRVDEVRVGVLGHVAVLLELRWHVFRADGNRHEGRGDGTGHGYPQGLQLGVDIGTQVGDLAVAREVSRPARVAYVGQHVGQAQRRHLA